MINFNLWKTHYELTKEQLGTDVTLEEYVKAYLEFSSKPNSERIYFKDLIDDCLLFSAEIEWTISGKPYYNIYPNIVDSTKRMNLSKIPCSMLDTVGNFKSILIKFSENSDTGIKMILAYKEEDNKCLTLFINCIPTKENIERILLVNKINLRDETSIEDIIEKTICKNQTPDTIDELVMIYSTKEISKKNSIKFYTLANFLSNYPSDLLIKYDISHKFKEQFSLATLEKKEEMIRISKKHGKIGWNIGVNEIMLGEIPRCSEEKEYLNEDERRELMAAHIRTGHLHIVRCGEAKRQAKVLWFRPTVVRPDLPFKD